VGTEAIDLSRRKDRFGSAKRVVFLIPRLALVNFSTQQASHVLQTFQIIYFSLRTLFIKKRRLILALNIAQSRPSYTMHSPLASPPIRGMTHQLHPRNPASYFPEVPSSPISSLRVAFYTAMPAVSRLANTSPLVGCLKYEQPPTQSSSVPTVNHATKRDPPLPATDCTSQSYGRHDRDRCSTSSILQGRPPTPLTPHRAPQLHPGLPWHTSPHHRTPIRFLHTLTQPRPWRCTDIPQPPRGDRPYHPRPLHHHTASFAPHGQWSTDRWARVQSEQDEGAHTLDPEAG